MTARGEEGPASSVEFEGVAPVALAARLGLPRVIACDAVGSTLDVAHHVAAAGAPAGTLILAESQTAGRGRGGKRWQSDRGAGLWLTLVERPSDARSLAVMSLRLGVHAAEALAPFVDGDVLLKWPNDLYVATAKLAGILVEARWREGTPDWVAIGFGLNVRQPRDRVVAALRDGTSRLGVLESLVPALRRAAAATGSLTTSELSAFHARDLARGRTCRAPVQGRVDGITADGELVVTTDAGVQHVNGGSLLLDGLDG